MDPLDPNVDWEAKLSASNKRKRPVNERRGDQDEEHEHQQRKTRTTSSTSYGSQVGTEDEEEDYEGGQQYEGDEGELDPDEILRLVNQLDKVETLDISGLKRLILKVEKAITKNQQHRVKYASDPRKVRTFFLLLQYLLFYSHFIPSSPLNFSSSVHGFRSGTSLRVSISWSTYSRNTRTLQRVCEVRSSDFSSQFVRTRKRTNRV
jgi:hypothetical protein